MIARGGDRGVAPTINFCAIQCNAVRRSRYSWRLEILSDFAVTVAFSPWTSHRSKIARCLGESSSRICDRTPARSSTTSAGPSRDRRGRKVARRVITARECARFEASRCRTKSTQSCKVASLIRRLERTLRSFAGTQFGFPCQAKCCLNVPCSTLGRCVGPPEADPYLRTLLSVFQCRERNKYAPIRSRSLRAGPKRQRLRRAA